MRRNQRNVSTISVHYLMITTAWYTYISLIGKKEEKWEKNFWSKGGKQEKRKKTTLEMLINESSMIFVVEFPASF